MFQHMVWLPPDPAIAPFHVQPDLPKITQRYALRRTIWKLWMASLAELSWDKLDIVAKHLRLNKAEAFHVLSNVLGEHPSNGTEFWLHVRSSYSFSMFLLDLNFLFDIYALLTCCQKPVCCVRMMNLLRAGAGEAV